MNARVHFRAGAGATLSHLGNMHYYPFGMLMEGLGTGTNSPANDYAYNGKELNEDFGLNLYAYGARYYDPSICRFTGTDPISDKFPWVSVYNYAENEPIGSIDLHGLQRYIVTNQYDDTQRISKTTITTVQNGKTLMNVNATNSSGSTSGADVIVFNEGNRPKDVGEYNLRASLNSEEERILNAGIDNSRVLGNTGSRRDGIESTGGFTFPGSTPPVGSTYMTYQYVGTFSDVTSTMEVSSARRITKVVAADFGFDMINATGAPGGPFLVRGIVDRSGGTTAGVVGNVTAVVNSIKAEGFPPETIQIAINVNSGPSFTTAHLSAARTFVNTSFIPQINAASPGIGGVSFNTGRRLLNNITIRGTIPAIMKSVTSRVLNP